VRSTSRVLNKEEAASRTTAGNHEGPIIDLAGDFAVIDCRDCGYRHVDPMPDEQWLETWYREHHYNDGARDRIDVIFSDRMAGYRDLHLRGGSR